MTKRVIFPQNQVVIGWLSNRGIWLTKNVIASQLAHIFEWPKIDFLIYEHFEAINFAVKAKLKLKEFPYKF